MIIVWRESKVLDLGTVRLQGELSVRIPRVRQRLPANLNERDGSYALAGGR